jgi:hypothetical protein
MQLVNGPAPAFQNLNLSECYGVTCQVAARATVMSLLWCTSLPHSMHVPCTGTATWTLPAWITWHRSPA